MKREALGYLWLMAGGVLLGFIIGNLLRFYLAPGSF